MESWAIVFTIFFLINFGIVYIWPIYQSLNKKIWFTILFLSSQRELHSVREILVCSRWGTNLYVTFSIHLSIAHHSSGTAQHVIIVFGTHVQNDISRCFLFFCFFEILIFWAVRGGGVAKNSPKWKITTSVTHHIQGTV